MLEREQVSVLFADARELYADALTQVQLGYLRNAAEKAWGATKRATDALVLARTGEEPRTTGQTQRGIRRLRRLDPALEPLRRDYVTASPICTAIVSTMVTWGRRAKPLLISRQR